MDEHSISIEYMELPGGADKNITYRTTSNSQDPFGIALPEFGGSLMPHRLCSPDGNSTGESCQACMPFDLSCCVSIVFIRKPAVLILIA
eukprot:scaffold110443_cov22-Tisochrysis_lutea.AAC.1